MIGLPQEQLEVERREQPRDMTCDLWSTKWPPHLTYHVLFTSISVCDIEFAMHSLGSFHFVSACTMRRLFHRWGKWLWDYSVCWNSGVGEELRMQIAMLQVPLAQRRDRFSSTFLGSPWPKCWALVPHLCWAGDLHWSQWQAGDVADCTAKDAGQAKPPSCQPRFWDIGRINMFQYVSMATEKTSGRKI